MKMEGISIRVWKGLDMTRHLGGLLNFIAGDLGIHFLYKYFCNF